ncbi:hypothetical protein M427DRAFT_327406 [Gonapodya prolifera JEL478]|uniref:Uncharacterized protein n=1 Tax=Gonapodya prolifera (strain JEL478) TaxID=1344416 RepID=A0A139AF40_GONPJ|nr:hypothetical protein M427DRAFT_327406 [Gonapodya prolifera JEL478]|eukprot:KXS15299.1 hypothetical protein M427DRAFT_327406 [Gonapodya prolifera JEL478]
MTANDPGHINNLSETEAHQLREFWAQILSTWSDPDADLSQYAARTTTADDDGTASIASAARAQRRSPPLCPRCSAVPGAFSTGLGHSLGLAVLGPPRRRLRRRERRTWGPSSSRTRAPRISRTRRRTRSRTHRCCISCISSVGRRCRT